MSKKGTNGKADNEKSTVKGCFPPSIGAVEPLFSQVLREPRFTANSMSRIRAVLVGTLISILSGCASDTVRTDVTSIATEPPQPVPALVYFLQPDFSDAIVTIREIVSPDRGKPNLELCGRLWGRRYFRMQVRTGRHSFLVRGGFQETPISKVFESGKTYYFRIDPPSLGGSSSLEVEELSKSEAIPLLREPFGGQRLKSWRGK